MRLHIYFTPAEVTALSQSASDIYIVIDVIRATTSLNVILEQGASRVLIADTLEQAREAARIHPGSLLCGERHARPLPDFDYGNSPVQFLRQSFDERTLILTTTNGTRAFFACPETSFRLAGSFNNAHAITGHALALARQHNSAINIVCAGEGGSFPLDDATCAGYLVREFCAQQPDLVLGDSVYAALALYETYAPPRLLDYCKSARSVRNAGLAADLDLCMQINRSQVIPQVTSRDQATNLLIIQQYTNA
ncbi:2-phosphosulfolactate phosphatase [Ktedonobacter robiniae]|uniref:Probable 2-phosphosulfolactate phosphatase n=1 Tax=Ktedonobacter robiniae TaxID=2778365 RepID=A0ABQ3UMQ2_9CHLR|nr:2-phosphosulfolactate phosphatase [Ktedonobacter robiniae]GHO54024.1 putative 2-phosphosulfolactate phosphatase [Ktedonobacter robiniae]